LENLLKDTEKTIVSYENKLATGKYNLECAKAEHKRDVDGMLALSNNDTC